MAETREQQLNREMSYAYSGPKPVDIVTPIGRGLRRWIPDIAALPGDIADAVVYAARRAATGNRNTPSAGLGAATRQWVKSKLERTAPRQQTEISAPEEYADPQQAVLEEAVALANPAMWNPRILTKPEVLGGLTAAFGGMPGMLGVVKPKGGNWLQTDIDRVLRGLKRVGPDEQVYSDFLKSDDGTQFAAWLNDRVRENPDYIKNNALQMVNDYLGEVGKPPLLRDPINQWIEGPLTKYVKSRLASPDDEVRKLAEQGILHFDPPYNMGIAGIAKERRKRAKEIGFIGERLGKSDLAKQWEDIADSSVITYPADKLLSLADHNDHDVLNKIISRDPKTPVHILDSFSPRDLGLSHLVDELRNALDPASDLPRHLRLTPEAINNMSMEKAIRRVDEINKWRAAQKVEANRNLAEQSTLVRGYTDGSIPNPKGLRWVELKAPKFTAESLPDGMKLKQWDYNGRPVWSVVDENGVTQNEAADSAEEALELFNEAVARKHLSDQLKYEGDVMGHCVGGYCDDVLAGRSRIFSLRDARGEPHVTIEVEPPMFVRNVAFGELSPEEKETVLKNLVSDGDQSLLRHFGDDTRVHFRSDNTFRLRAPDTEQDEDFIRKAFSPRIIQIKGKQNKAPNDEYLPFVQDFVRNSPLGSPWADVGDMQNARLRKIDRSIFESLGPSGEDAFDQLMNKGVHFLTDKEIQEIYDAIYNTGKLPDNFASGGQVKPKTNGDLLNAHDLSYNSAVGGWNIFGAE